MLHPHKASFINHTHGRRPSGSFSVAGAVIVCRKRTPSALFLSLSPTLALWVSLSRYGTSVNSEAKRLQSSFFNLSLCFDLTTSSISHRIMRIARVCCTKQWRSSSGSSKRCCDTATTANGRDDASRAIGMYTLLRCLLAAWLAGAPHTSESAHNSHITHELIRSQDPPQHHAKTPAVCVRSLCAVALESSELETETNKRIGALA